MLNKCTCGKYTDYGITCVSCSMSKNTEREEEDINIDELIEELTTPLDIEDSTQIEDRQALPEEYKSTENLELIDDECS